MQNCTDKFLKHSERVGARFAEHNAGSLLMVSISRELTSQSKCKASKNVAVIVAKRSTICITSPGSHMYKNSHISQENDERTEVPFHPLEDDVLGCAP